MKKSLKSEDLNSGHRQRSKQRFLNNEPNMLDYELLEILLFYSIPRKDVKPIAKKLLAEFGSLTEVFNASIDDLTSFETISLNTAILIKMQTKISKEILKQKLIKKPVISNWQALQSYCFLNIAFSKNELVHALYLNTKNMLIKDEKICEGTTNYINIDFRKIVEQSLRLGASSLILIHNHPSGNPDPSIEDIKVTKNLAKSMRDLNITLFDHIIISKGGFYSFKYNGLI